MLARLGVDAGVEPFEASALLTGRVVAHDARYRLTRLDCGGAQLTLPETDLAIGETVRVRVRARDVALATIRPEGVSIRNVLPADVIAVSAPDDAAQAEVTLAAAGAQIRARITREAMAELAIAPGAKVFALVKSVSFDGRA